jgi:hypothetical protein
MKKLSLFIWGLLFACNISFAQVTTITGALSIYNVCTNGVNSNGCGNSPNPCNLAGNYTFLTGTNSTACGLTQYDYNCGNNSGTSPYGSGNKDGYHYSMYSSVLIPSGCVATVVAEYGAPMNVGSLNSATEDCANAGMDAGGTDILGISTGYASSPLAANWLGAIPSLPSTNIGTCAAGTAGVNGATLNNSSSGCWVTGGGGNSDVICTLVGQTNISVTMWAGANRSDEILTYTITGTGAACSDIGIVVLPIQLIGFAAYQTTNADIMIDWATATETNNAYFMLEYSLDAKNFIPYKEIKGAGNSNTTKKYSCPFTLDINNETPYFRLKQVDYNGRYKYSQIIMLGTSAGSLKTTELISYYNADNTSIISKVKLDAPAQVSFSLYNTSGQEIYSSINQFAEGDNQFLIPAPEVGGVYILVYQNGSSAPVHKKVMVTR